MGKQGLHHAASSKHPLATPVSSHKRSTQTSVKTRQNHLGCTCHRRKHAWSAHTASSHVWPLAQHRELSAKLCSGLSCRMQAHVSTVAYPPQSLIQQCKMIGSQSRRTSAWSTPSAAKRSVMTVPTGAARLQLLAPCAAAHRRHRGGPQMLQVIQFCSRGDGMRRRRMRFAAA